MVLIGVVPSDVEKKILSFTQAYPEAVLRAGGLPVIFPVTSDVGRLSSLLDQVDGLLLTGGVDVEPFRYGQEKKPCCGECSPVRDEMEFPLCRLALERRKPLLAICRGIQLLNCALGGSLYQDLEAEFGSALRHPRSDTPADPVHEVTVLPDTLLASVYGAGTLGVNSRHHQGIQALGQGLVVSARASDGLIEGVEFQDHPFAVGVQWHPESMSDHIPAQQNLFNAFIRACAENR